MTENKKTVVTDENKEEAKIIDGQEASTSGEDSPPGCPICAFIEAGDCKLQHQEWTACREQAKKDGIDYVDACHDQFKVFIQCAMDHSDYYDPFLSMLLGDEESSEAEPGNPVTSTS